MNPTVLHRVLLGYAGTLAAVGVLAYYIGPRHSPMSLLGGVGGGALVAVLSVLWRKRVLWSKPALTTAVGIFTLSFLWRAVESWLRAEIYAACVLAGLTALSLPLFVVLFRRWNR